MFGSTECGATLLSTGDRGLLPGHLRPLAGTLYTFVPVHRTSETMHQSTGRLLELVVLADSGDCPDGSLRGSDGDFHTGDLFQEVVPGQYLFRGRDDDWIKTEASLRCDTKSAFYSSDPRKTLSLIGTQSH